VANGSQKKWVSDIIGDDYKKWNSELVVLDCGTASGKTYFSIKILGGYAQKMNRHILYLCNRTELRHQISNQVNKLKLHNTICVTSYQTLQSKLQKGEVYGYYDYIIADECHYFITDARFNDSTDIAYNYIMSQKESVVLLVSYNGSIVKTKNKVFYNELICM
jgi:superfamily II DNA or RNA helicase